jgi:hypothetical protein
MFQALTNLFYNYWYATQEQEEQDATTPVEMVDIQQSGSESDTDPEPEVPSEPDEETDTEVDENPEELYNSKLPIYVHGKNAEQTMYSLRDRMNIDQVTYCDPKSGEIIRAEWLHHWMTTEGCVAVMASDYYNTPTIKRQPNAKFVYIGADTGTLVATIITERENEYDDEDFSKYKIHTQEIYDGNIKDAISQLWAEILVKYDFRGNIQYVMLYGYRLRDLAFEFNCPQVKEHENFYDLWNEEERSLAYTDDDYEAMGFTSQVCYPGTRNTFSRSSMPGFHLIHDTVSPNADVVYKIPAFRFPEEGNRAIYLDDESITLMSFPEADTVESFKLSHFNTVDEDEIIRQSIQYFNELTEKENE